MLNPFVRLVYRRKCYFDEKNDNNSVSLYQEVTIVRNLHSECEQFEPY